jgi:HEPN domain-containing protein
VKRHIDEYKGDRNFAFLDQFGDCGEHAAAIVPQAASAAEMEPSYTPGAAPNSWCAEFERDCEREASAVAEAKVVAARRNAALRITPEFASTRAVSTRKLDFEEAERYQVQSARAQCAAAELESHSPDYSVFLSHQAAELILKSLMLRTCGITDEQMRAGPGKGHSLEALMVYISATEQHAWPPGLERELQSLSHAYIAARYSSGGALPSSRYEHDTASAALETVRKLKAWVAACIAVPTPTTQFSYTAINMPSRPGDVVFEPAPLPASAVRARAPTPSIEPAPTALPISDQHTASAGSLRTDSTIVSMKGNHPRNLGCCRWAFVAWSDVGRDGAS